MKTVTVQILMDVNIYLHVDLKYSAFTVDP